MIQLHLVGKGCEVRGGNLFVGILDAVQMLNKEIASPRPVAEQKFDLMRGLRIYLATLGRRLGLPPPFARMFERANLLHVVMAH
jgi:hypothetical protein